MTRSSFRRPLLVVALLWLLGVAFAASAGSAAADTPEGWPEEEAVDTIGMLLFLGGVPLLVFIVIVALTYGPALARGESIKPGTQSADEWLGGPRKSAGELAGPDAEGSQAGGAGGSW